MYRLLFSTLVDVPRGCWFQSPNGVQIAFPSCAVFFRFYRIVSITKRCTDCFPNMRKHTSIKQTFQSPNGVQIALKVMITFSSSLSKFQSPNGVQIAFPNMRKHTSIKQTVSITKRCTDCFNSQIINYSIIKAGFNHQTVYRLLCEALNAIERERLESFNHQTVYRLLSLLNALFTVSGCFNHQTVYRLLCGKNGNDCRQKRFNHQTVYRLLLISSRISRISIKFQSPNGVQIAFAFFYIVPIILDSFNHQTVYRLL